MKAKLCIIILIIFLLIFVSSCGINEDLAVNAEPVATEFVKPAAEVLPAEDDYWPTNGWRTSTPEQHGMDSEILAQFAKEAGQYNTSLGIKSYVVVKDDYIVAEAYFKTEPDKTEPIYSITKSVVSAVYGIALHERKVVGVDEKVLDCFPGIDFNNNDDNKESMTIKNLLTMTTGLDWYESSDPTMSMESAPDRVSYVLDTPMAAVPGEEYSYNNGAAQVVTEYIEKSTGMTFDSYTAEKLFKPLGISNYSFRQYKDGEIAGYAGLKLTAHDMAKLGFLFLHEGEWDGKQVIPKEWVEESTQNHTKTGGKGGEFTEGYGYYWWVDSFGSYSARGMYDQVIIVNPELNMVVVFQANFCGPMEKNQMIPLQLARDYIFPAVVSSQPLPQNPDALAKLKEFQLSGS